MVDAAHVLSAADIQVLDSKLLDLQVGTGIQFAIATVPSLDGEEIEPYANELFRRWKVGKKDVNNGLLLIVAPTEHKLRFEVGYGLEGTMTDLQSKLIITNTMVPKLKAGDMAGAIRAGVDDAVKVLTKDPSAVPAKAPDQPLDTTTLVLLFAGLALVFIVIVVVARRSRGGWTWSTGGSAFGAGTGLSTGGDDSPSSSDSFSGGGGGDSGGGGASGNW